MAGLKVLGTLQMWFLIPNEPKRLTWLTWLIWLTLRFS